MVSYSTQGYDLLRAWCSASCGISQQTGLRFATGIVRAWCSAACGILQQTGGTICYGHGVLHLVIAYSRQGGTIHCGHQVLLPLILHSRQEVRFVTGMGVCILWYLTSGRGYYLLRAWVSAFCDIKQQTEVRFATAIGFCILWYFTADRG